MARITSKRKSESALSFEKGKQRKTVAATIRGIPDSEDQETQIDEELFVQDQLVAAKYVKKNNNAKSRKSEPLYTTRDEEYEEDPGRAESLQFLSLIEYEAKKKKVAARDAARYLENLTKNLDHDEQELRTQLEGWISVSEKKDSAFLSAFRVAYIAASPCPKPNRGGDQDPPEHRGFESMYKKSKLLMGEALELASCFDRTSQQVQDFDNAKLVDNMWGEENDKAAQLLEAGRDVGIERYRSMLTVSNEVALIPEETEDAQAIVENRTDQRSSAWGKVAKKEEKAIKKLVKAIALQFD